MAQHTKFDKATEKQISFLRSLGKERISPSGSWRWDSDPDFFETVTKVHASYMIDKMKALPKKPQDTLPVDVKPLPPVEGIHVVHTPKGVAIVKVQKALYGSGRLYTKVFSPSAKKFVQQSGWLKKVNASTLMNADEAAKYGATYGVCMRCARPLTDEESIASGMGPYCRSEMGW